MTALQILILAYLAASIISIANAVVIARILYMLRRRIDPIKAIVPWPAKIKAQQEAEELVASRG